MTDHSYSQEELERFGIVPSDEGLHPYPPDTPPWQESIFYDWTDRTGTWAGHCRLGLHPHDKKIWLWLFLTDGTGWLAIEKAALPYQNFEGDDWRFQHEDLHFERLVPEGLRKNILRVSGMARGISGAYEGQEMEVAVQLQFDCAGPAYSMGGRAEKGKDGQKYDAKRFEQPMMVQGDLHLGTKKHSFDGMGERDHSWGSRHWALMDWTFLTLHSSTLRAQCTEVSFGENQFTLGYVQNPTMRPVFAADFDLTLNEDIQTPSSGTIRIPLEEGQALEGTLEQIGVVPIQISHVYPMPMEAVYRRALIRWHPSDGSAPALGWLEWCKRKGVDSPPA